MSARTARRLSLSIGSWAFAACVSSASVPVASPVPVARVAPPRVYRVDYLPELGDAPLLVEPEGPCRRVPRADDAEAGVALISAEPAQGSDVVSGDGSCLLHRGRRLALEDTNAFEDELEICELTAIELRPDDACDGWLAVDDPRATFSRPPELEWEEDGPIQGDHTLVFEDLVLHEHRGPPIDEICPDSATLDVTRSDGSVVGRWEGQSIFDVHAILTVDGHRWLMIRDRLVPLDGGEPGRTWGGRFDDSGADPCG